MPFSLGSSALRNAKFPPAKPPGTTPPSPPPQTKPPVGGNAPAKPQGNTQPTTSTPPPAKPIGSGSSAPKSAPGNNAQIRPASTQPGDSSSSSGSTPNAANKANKVDNKPEQAPPPRPVDGAKNIQSILNLTQQLMGGLQQQQQQNPFTGNPPQTTAPLIPPAKP